MSFNQDRYFFLSGLISITLFLVLLFLSMYSLVLSPTIEHFAMKESEYVSVSLMEPTTAEIQTSTEALNAPEKAEPEPVEEKPIVEEEEIPEISDLFSQVKVDRTPKKIREESKHREQLSALEKEILEKKDSPRFSDKVSKVDLVKPSVKMVTQSGSSGPIVNEYHAKIQGLVYTYFRPPAGTVGEVARVRMSIGASGKLISYKVITYSGNRSFNSEVEWLKDRLVSVRFPEHPEGKDAILEFILTAKE
ncbi:TonB C-terminal domain-containing protein [Sulfuricurvum sp.]|uniref:cell envelope integrity protein TolA n=1 Tax=Sulfuricurvum sp. TaxID=2025608 RepID=UPI00286E21BB|nr:TonB C-terminal domain-containing protein [Sulfuricurvum sp.]